MNRWLLLLVLAVAVAAAGGILLLRSSGASSDPELRALTTATAPTPAQRDALQREAGNACRCARRLSPGNAGRNACWAAFDRQVSRFRHSEGGTLCGPMSTEEICFDDGNCIFKTYGDNACSQDEARVLEVIVDEDFLQNDERFRRRMNEAVQAFIRGERIEAPRRAGGCAG